LLQGRMEEGIMLTSLDAKGMKKINSMWKIQMVSVHTSIETMGRSEVWRWSSIIWLCPGGIEDRKVMAVMAAWWYHRGEM